MKKIFHILMFCVLVFSLTVTITVKADSNTLNYITDTVGILSQRENNELENFSEKIAQKYDCSVYAVILDDYYEYGSNLERICESFYREYNLGADTNGNVVFLLLSMEDRDYWLMDFGSHMSYAITDYGHESLKDAFLDDFGDNDWYEGLYDYLQQSEVILAAAESGEVYDVEPLSVGEKIVMSYVPALVIGVLVAFAMCSIYKSQMKTAVEVSFADNYVAADGVEMRIRQDRYTHTTKTKRKIKSESSGSSRSGGSRSSGGNHSSGGKF